MVNKTNQPLLSVKILYQASPTLAPNKTATSMADQEPNEKRLYEPLKHHKAFHVTYMFQAPSGSQPEKHQNL
jgi:hypothetical protein